MLLLIEVTVTSRTPTPASALGPTTIITIIELQWTILSRRVAHDAYAKISGGAASVFVVT
jgi:hypothetical protein